MSSNSSEVPLRAAIFPKIVGTPFWRRKMTTAFKKLDSNGDGCLSREDFEQVGDAMCKLNNLSGADAEKVKSTLLTMWENYYSTSFGAETKLDDYLTRKLDLANGSFRRDLDSFGRVMFRAIDFNNDGVISGDEFSSFAEAWRIGKDCGHIIFQIMDKNADGEISIDEFLDALSDFYFSEDTASPFKIFWGPMVDS